MIETVPTTIYEDYSFVFERLTSIYKRGKKDSAQVAWLRAKRQAVDEKAAIYDTSPLLEKMEEATLSAIEKEQNRKVETSYAFQYYRFLQQFNINFQTSERVAVDVLPLFQEGEGSWNDKNHDHHRTRREGRKIGRNDPCPCGSGKKYKKCCLEQDRRKMADPARL